MKRNVKNLLKSHSRKPFPTSGEGFFVFQIGGIIIITMFLLDNARKVSQSFKSLFMLILVFLLHPHFSYSQSCCANGNSIITTYAGIGALGYTGDGGPATLATFKNLVGTASDSIGNLYICDEGNSVVRKISSGGIITTYAGNGTAGFSGDGGPATLAQLWDPVYIAFDTLGNSFISDFGDNRIRKVDASGIITTFAGNGLGSYSGDGGPATQASIWGPFGVAVDGSGNVFISDYNSTIRKVNTLGIITTIAGNGTMGYSGDDGPATLAILNIPEAVAVDSAENVYFNDDDGGPGGRVRKIDASGIITTIAGNGGCCFSGDGGPATLAVTGDVQGIAFCSENIYLSDWRNNRIRVINSLGIINTIAGNGASFDSGDGGLASSANLKEPNGITFDSKGNLYVAEDGGNRVRKIAQPCTSTPTATFSPTSIRTPTITPSFTVTATSTVTPTASASSSTSATASATSSPTFTLTQTPTPTWTVTITPTITSTFTITPTPTVPGNFMGLTLYPNPSSDSSLVKVQIPLKGTTKVKVKVFTVAFRKVWELDTDTLGPPGTEVVLPLTDNWGTPLANGLYYVQISTDQGSSTLKWLVLR